MSCIGISNFTPNFMLFSQQTFTMKCYTEFQCYITGSVRKQMLFGYLFLIVRPLSHYSGSLELVLPIVIKYFAAIDRGAANIYIVDKVLSRTYFSVKTTLISFKVL